MNEEDFQHLMKQIEGDAEQVKLVRNLAMNTRIFYNKLIDDGIPPAVAENFTMGFLGQTMVLNKDGLML